MTISGAKMQRSQLRFCVMVIVTLATRLYVLVVAFIGPCLWTWNDPFCVQWFEKKIVIIVFSKRMLQDDNDALRREFDHLKTRFSESLKSVQPSTNAFTPKFKKYILPNF